jgi:hypothetical protein
MGPATPDRSRMAALAVGVGVALSVAGLRVRAAAAAHTDVAGLNRPRLLAGGVVEVGLDRRRRAPEPICYPPDREALGLPVAPRQRDGSATLDNPVGPPCHDRSRYLAHLVFPRQSARRALKEPQAPPNRVRRGSRGQPAGSCASRAKRVSVSGSACGTSTTVPRSAARAALKAAVGVGPGPPRARRWVGASADRVGKGDQLPRRCHQARFADCVESDISARPLVREEDVRSMAMTPIHRWRYRGDPSNGKRPRLAATKETVEKVGRPRPRNPRGHGMPAPELVRADRSPAGRHSRPCHPRPCGCRYAQSDGPVPTQAAFSCQKKAAWQSRKRLVPVSLNAAVAPATARRRGSTAFRASATGRR